MAKKYGRAETVALEKSDGTAYELRAQSPWQEKLTVTASIFLLASNGIAAAESFDNLEQALENPERTFPPWKSCTSPGRDRISSTIIDRGWPASLCPG